MSFLTPEDRTTGSFILRSRDDGRTWGDATLVSKPVDGETSLVRLSSGKLLAALRRCYPDAEHDTWLSDSDDDGYTWSAPRRVTGHMQHPADLVQLADGRILLVFGHRRVPFGVRALISRDEGKSWDHDNTLVLASESIDRDCGYPSVVQLDDGQIVVAYYVHHGLGPSLIRLTRLAARMPRPSSSKQANCRNVPTHHHATCLTQGLILLQVTRRGRPACLPRAQFPKTID